MEGKLKKKYMRGQYLNYKELWRYEMRKARHFEDITKDLIGDMVSGSTEVKENMYDFKESIYEESDKDA